MWHTNSPLIGAESYTAQWWYILSLKQPSLVTISRDYTGFTAYYSQGVYPPGGTPYSTLVASIHSIIDILVFHHSANCSKKTSGT